MKKTIISAFVAVSTLITTVGMSFGDLLVPVMTYRVGPFAANGTQNANGFVDYLTMLNERDGGINGVKIKDDTSLRVISFGNMIKRIVRWELIILKIFKNFGVKYQVI